MVRRKKKTLNQNPTKSKKVSEKSENVLEKKKSEETEVVEKNSGISDFFNRHHKAPEQPELVEEEKIEKEAPELVEEVIEKVDPEQPELVEEEKIEKEVPKVKTLADLSTEELRLYRRTGMMPK